MGGGGSKGPTYIDPIYTPTVPNTVNKSIPLVDKFTNYEYDSYLLILFIWLFLILLFFKFKKIRL